MNGIYKICLAAICVGTIPATALADETYPQRPITLVVSSAPGGALDVTGRLLATELGKQLNGSVVVENKPGANSTIGARQVARAEPDGYTLLLTSESSMSIAPVVMDVMPFDVENDLVPVSLVATLPMLLVANPELGATSVNDLIKLAKQKPGALRYGTAGLGSVHYFGMELFQSAAGIKMMHVPYKAGPQTITDLVAGNIDVALLAGGVAAPLIASKRILGLAVTATEEIKAAPGIKPVAETLPGFKFETWFAMFAPAGTPDEILQKLHRAIEAALQSDTLRESLAKEGILAEASTPEALQQRVVKDRQKFIAIKEGTK